MDQLFAVIRAIGKGGWNARDLFNGLRQFYSK